MMNKLSNKELVAAGHKFAANLDADMPLIDMAKMVSELATRLDVALAVAAEAGKQRDALAAENGLAAKAVQTFCDVVGSNTDVIAEEMGMEGAKAILAAMSATGNMPATDAYLNSVRAEGVDKAIEHLHEKFSSTGHIGVPVMALEWLSTQLRAGKDGE